MDKQANRPWDTAAVCNIAGALTWQASRQPDVAAIHYPTRSLLKGWHYQTCSYYQLDELSNAYGRSIDGILGGNFLVKGIISINFVSKELCMYPFDISNP